MKRSAVQAQARSKAQLPILMRSGDQYSQRFFLWKHLRMICSDRTDPTTKPFFSKQTDKGRLCGDGNVYYFHPLGGGILCFCFDAALMCSRLRGSRFPGRVVWAGLGWAGLVTYHLSQSTCNSILSCAPCVPSKCRGKVKMPHG